MIRTLIHWLSGGSYKGSSRDHAPGTCAARVVHAATDARAAAYAELRAAEDRGDTRSIGHARMKLAAATHDQLSAEVWG